MRRAVIGLVAVGSLVSLLVGLVLAQAKKPDATLTLTEGSVAVGIGYSWGKGTLDYQGKKHPVKVEGLSVGEVGVTRATGLGKSTTSRSSPTSTATMSQAARRRRSRAAPA